MADDDDTSPGMEGRARFVYGPRPLGNLVPTITRQAYRRHNPASAQIIADWEIIVGPKVASMTVPRRLDRGVLTIACAGPTAMNLHYMGIEVINRINTHLGGQPVHSLKFTQAGMPRNPPIQPFAAARSGSGGRGSGRHAAGRRAEGRAGRPRDGWSSAAANTQHDA